MGRPRNKSRSDLPQYLYYEANRGYRLTLVNGKKRFISKQRDVAIQVALEYNRQMRPKIGIQVDTLVAESVESDSPKAPFANHVDTLIETAILEEQPSGGLIDTWLNDVKRIKEFFDDIPANQIELSDVTAYLDEYHGEASGNVFNRKVAFLEKVFSYAIDQGLMVDNPASRKKKKRVDKKKRRRLSLEAFNKIHAAAPLWLQVAMDLALQASQGVLEVSRVQYRITQPAEKRCGCVWNKEPVDGVYGTLFIHRQKVQEKEASFVAIPIGEELKRIVDRSRDGLHCPFIVHRKPDRNNKQSQATSHKFQVTSNYLSRAFSAVRDSIGLYEHWPSDTRPTFHEIRALSARLFSDQGVDPQGRMAHTDAKTTKTYTRNHLEWTEVPHAEIDKNRAQNG